VTATRTEFGAARTTCSCKACAINCQYIPGYLIPADLPRLIPADADPEAWAREHLLASPGAVIMRVHLDGRREVGRVGTLVPAHVAGSLACHWFKGGRCEVHAIAPFGCAFFDAHQTREQSDARSEHGLKAIIADNAEGGLYARLWAMLHGAGLRAPDPGSRRAAMAAGIEADRRARRPRR
jgi:Fe-S-cluster containining protein